MNVAKPLLLLAEFVTGPRGLRRIFTDDADVLTGQADDTDETHPGDMPRPDDWARWPSRLRSRPRFHP